MCVPARRPSSPRRAQRRQPVLCGSGRSRKPREAGDAPGGLRLMRAIPPGILTGYPGFHLRRLISLGFAEVAAIGRADPSVIEAAGDLARKQRAGSMTAAVSLLKSLGSTDISNAVLSAYR